MALVQRRNPQQGIRHNWNLADFGSLGDIVSEFDGLFNQLATRPADPGRLAQGYPIDLYETGEALVLQMAVPGVAAENLDISIEGRQLTIQGTLPGLEEGEGRRYWLQSIPRGQFRRSLTLPVGVSSEDIEARVRNGLLTLTMPKVDEAKARKITITSE